jgi:hypothetical protein
MLYYEHSCAFLSREKERSEDRQTLEVVTTPYPEKYR